MASVTLSSAVRNNLLSLQSTANQLGKTQERLATGLKVNSALDDPTAFFTAASLNSRAGDLNRLLDSVGNAVQTIKAADQGLTAITSLVENLQATARQALQKPAQVSNPAAAAQVTGGTFFAANDTAATLTGSVNLAADTAATTTGTAIAADVAATVTGTVTGLTGTDTLDTLGFANGDQVTITTESGGTTTFTVGTATVDTVNTLVSALDANTGVGVSLSGGAIVATAANNTNSITFGEGGQGTNLAGIGFNTTQVDPTNATVAALDGTLSVQVGSNTAFTLDLSTVNNRAELGAALSNPTGGTLTLNGGGQIVATASANTDDITISVSGATSNAADLQNIGIGDGTQTSVTIEPTNGTAGLAAAIAGNETLVFTVGSNSDTITFGTNDGANQVSNRGELAARLAALSSSSNTSGTFSVTGNNIVAQSPTVAAGNISVAGGTNALAFAGFTANQSASATNAALTALTQADFTVNFGGAGAETIDFSTINSVEDLDTALGALVNGTGSRTTNGAIQFTGANLTDNIVVGGTVTGTGVTAGTTSATAASVTPNTERAALETEFNNLRTQIDQLAGDASFNGVNLLNGDNLTVIFNENNTSSLAITGGNFNSTGLGVNAITSGEFQDNANINSTLSTLDTTISTLRQQASTFGSNLSVVEVRQDFTKNLINTLETGAANLTLADTNEEGANLLALQTRQQLSSVALSLASQSDQNVLRLF